MKSQFSGLAAVFLVSTLIVSGCGGGGGTTSANNPGGASTTGTAAQYFSKKAVGNSWSYSGTSIDTISGVVSAPVATTWSMSITGASGAVVTMATNGSYGGVPSTPATHTEQINSNGDWVVTRTTGSTYIVLPASISVGATWAAESTNSASGAVTTTGRIVATNVSKTVPAGTFSDCLQVEMTTTGTTWSTVDNYYYSPTVGMFVEGTYVYTYPNGVENSTEQLQAGYVANP